VHIDVVLFFHWLKDPAISRRRLRWLIWKMEGNCLGPRKVSNKELCKVLDALKRQRPEILTEAELASLYHVLR
jgi:hypothetical protein